jgi:hypothetical protein
MVYPFSGALTLLLVIVGLWLWPTSSPLPRQIAILLLCAAVLPVYLLWYHGFQAYYRFRIWWLSRKIARLERLMRQSDLNKNAHSNERSIRI